MAKFLTEVRGFTPVIDVVVQDVGLGAAAVYGVMWRYCQMEDRVCKAAVATIAAKIGRSRSTVIRCIEVLVAAGYIVDTTPNTKNAPHIYVDAGKARITGLLSVSECDTEVCQNDTPVCQNDTPRCVKMIHKDSSLREQARKKEETAAAASISVSCSIHNKPMTLKNKDGDTWYSHRLADGTWCKGAPGDQPTTPIDPRRYITGEYSDLIQH